MNSKPFDSTATFKAFRSHRSLDMSETGTSKAKRYWNFFGTTGEQSCTDTRQPDFLCFFLGQQKEMFPPREAAGCSGQGVGE